MITKFRSGFTLIELAVVVAIFGILCVVAANYLIATVSTNNRISVENEVRQNASLIMTDIAAEVRKAACLNSTATSLVISDAPCGKVGKIVTFSVSSAGVLSKNSEVVSSKYVRYCGQSSACNGSPTCLGGLVVSPIGETDDAIDVQLSAQQNKSTTRQDSCAGVVLSETITPRNNGK